MTMDKKDVVILTGFGLFRDYEANPSWEAVKLVDEKEFDDIEIIKILVPVAYKDVDQVVEEIWSKYDPILVIHCGVSCIAKGITLEKRAVVNIERYCSPDVNKCVPDGNNNTKNECCQSRVDYLSCQLDLDSICKEINDRFNQNLVKLPAYVSERAGEYLCEYIYRGSLQKNNQRTFFIHVPNVSEKFTPLDFAKCLEIAIKSAIDQIKNCRVCRTSVDPKNK